MFAGIEPLQAQGLWAWLVDPRRPMSDREQGLRYLVVGGWNTLFGYGAFTFVHTIALPEIHYLLQLIVATVIGTLNAFCFYRWFVFRVRGHVLRDLWRFSQVYIGALALNLMLLPLLVEVFGLPVLLGQAVLVVTTVLSSFVAHRRYSFRRPHLH